MPKFNLEEISRIIEMAWEDRTPFEAIKQEFDLDQAGVKKLMQKELNSGSFLVWKKRVRGRKTKHASLRSFKVGRHQSYDNNKIKKYLDSNGTEPIYSPYPSVGYVNDIMTDFEKNKNINNEQEVKEAQNRYAKFQRENPHTPRTMKALGLPEKDIEEFCTDALFPYVE